jgi:hypothetical protein
LTEENKNQREGQAKVPSEFLIAVDSPAAVDSPSTNTTPQAAHPAHPAVKKFGVCAALADICGRLGCAEANTFKTNSKTVVYPCFGE